MIAVRARLVPRSKSLIERTSVYCDKLMVIQESISAQWGTGRKRRRGERKKTGKEKTDTYISLRMHATILAGMRERRRQTDGRTESRTSQTYKWRIEGLSPRDICQRSLWVANQKGYCKLPNFSGRVINPYRPSPRGVYYAESQQVVRFNSAT